MPFPKRDNGFLSNTKTKKLTLLVESTGPTYICTLPNLSLFKRRVLIFPYFKP